MKQLVLISILAITAFASQAQNKCSIYKATAYFTVSMPGTQFVDENGNRIPPVPNVQRIIYLECTGKKEPVIQSIAYDNTLYHAQVSDSTVNTVAVGKRFQDEKAVVLKPRKGNRLWKLELQPVIDKPQSPDACKNITIKLRVNNTVCSFHITGSEMQLYTLPAY